ncbi:MULTISPECIES: hypothetical protein [Aeromonas]|uniref:hypothetical protein n=1 Tax=Aeromonas TaxID=642 RepID=UPI00214E87D2|nr:hypothetical protein [Aeromonas caviae]MCR3936994.1 hypothetical protein [Aeromonas caviae]
MTTHDNFIKSVEDWRNIVVLNAESNSLNSFVDSVVSSSPDIDNMSRWALGASGAIAGLIISNIDKVGSAFYNSFEIKLMLLMLVISILCGLGQRSLAVLCAIHIKIKEALSIKLKEILADFDADAMLIKEMAENHDLDISVELNLESVITTFIEISPRSIRYLIKKESAKSMTNPVHSAEKILGIYYRQNIWLLFQGVFFIAFILCAVVFI